MRRTFVRTGVQPGISSLAAALVAVAVIALAPPRAHADLFVSDYYNDRVLRYNETTKELIGTLTNSELSHPMGLVFGPGGYLYVSSYGNSKVVRFNIEDGTCSPFVAGGQLDAPVGLVFGSDGYLYVSSVGNGKVLRYNTDGSFKDTFASEVSGLNSPQGLVFGPDGYLYVSNYNTNQVLRYTAPENGETFVSGLSGPTGLVFGTDNKLYVSNYASSKVRHYTTDTTYEEVSVSGPIGLLFGPNNELYVNSLSGQVLRYDADLSPKDPFASAPASMFEYLTFTLTDPVTLAYTPEAPTWTLFSLGLVVLAAARWRRRKAGRSEE